MGTPHQDQKSKGQPQLQLLPPSINLKATTTIGLSRYHTVLVITHYRRYHSHQELHPSSCLALRLLLS